MNSGANEKTSNRTKIFETILSSPGMGESCKIVLNPTRQTILLLARLIENGVEKKDGDAKVQAPVKLTTLRRFKLTSAGRSKLTTLRRSKLTT